jgi:hypothetical protein
MRFTGVVAIVVLSATILAGCEAASDAAPECRAGQRLALVAQSVPSAAYVPCVASLATGWQTAEFRAESGRTSFELTSDRSERPVDVDFRRTCRIDDATPVAPRADGARTHVKLQSIAPRYAGTLYDVFPGGCVTYRFDFERGPHIALMADFQASIALYSRRALRLRLERDAGVRLP